MDPNDRQRKDRLIQTRVPQNLESTLKDEARKRRLSVSHLIRNVLEDTFNLVDNVVTEVDRVVADSVGVAQTLRRDAQRLAATARGETAHRNGVRPENTEPSAPDLEVRVSQSAPASPEPNSASDEPTQDALIPQPAQPAAPDPLNAGALAHVFGFQELVLNRSERCAACGKSIARGEHAFLGMTDQPGPRVWVCQDCISSLSP
ncbi:MAG TPA: hypothetical protein VFZ61_19025 [Polyangiales bacterium]